jgi:hypothetical protein
VSLCVAAASSRLAGLRPGSWPTRTHASHPGEIYWRNSTKSPANPSIYRLPRKPLSVVLRADYLFTFRPISAIGANHTRRRKVAAIVPGEGLGVARGWLRTFIDNLAERVSKASLSRVGPALVGLRRAIGFTAGRVIPPANHITKVGVSRAAATLGALRAVGEDTLDRIGALRWRLRSTRLGRSADGIIVIPLLVAALVLGVFAATAATNDSSPNADAGFTPTAGSSDENGEVVTETVVRDGETVRVVRHEKKPGHLVLETVSGRAVTLPGASVTIPGGSVTLPGHTSTVHETRTETVNVTNTVTTQELVTVTETQMVTTTVVEAEPEG